VVTGLVQRFPNVSVIDLSAIMDQVVRVSEQVSKAVEFVFLFAIAAGLVVLFAAISATQDERVFEGAIMRTLGASRRQMTIMQLAEFLAIGLLSGTIAAAGSVGLAMVLSDKVLGVPYEFNAFVPVMGLLAGGLGVAIAGLIGTRKAVSSPPLRPSRRYLTEGWRAQVARDLGRLRPLVEAVALVLQPHVPGREALEAAQGSRPTSRTRSTPRSAPACARPRRGPTTPRPVAGARCGCGTSRRRTRARAPDR
jgi:hypothetical protein